MEGKPVMLWTMSSKYDPLNCFCELSPNHANKTLTHLSNVLLLGGWGREIFQLGIFNLIVIIKERAKIGDGYGLPELTYA